MSFIKLLQLPIPEVHHLYTEGNVPLAAGYLKAYAIKKGAAEEQDIEIIDRDTVNNAGDAAIMEQLVTKETRIVGFTSYMWNIERNLFMAGKIKQTRPDIHVIMGGPEIVPEHPAAADTVVDTVVIGEGEQAFVDFLQDFNTGNAQKRAYQGQQPLDLKDVPNPYLQNILAPAKGESMFLETMRGCPYPCKYCFYSKSHNRMRYFPEEQLPLLFELARQSGVPEIYFMDPSFNVTPGLKEKLERIRQLNTTRIPIHTETRLESVTPGIARLMREAGFKSVEAGLQSTNEKALAAIARDWNRGRFIQGAKLLTEQGIDVKTGIILGLPYDSSSDFENTLDFVINLDLQESMEIYPLSLIPGTRLRDEAESFGLTYMPHPPYWVTSTPYMDEQQIKQSVEMVEHKVGIEFFPPVIPCFHNNFPGPVHYLDLRENTGHSVKKLIRHPEQVGHSLTLIMNEQTDRKLLEQLGRTLRKENPYILVQLVLDQAIIPRLEDIRHLIDSFYFSDHFYNRIHHYKIDSQDRYSLRFFHLTGSLETVEAYLYRPLFCDLIVRYTIPLLDKGRDILADKPILLVESPVSSEERKELLRIYDGFEEFIVFKSQ
jgi:molybdenum cofactor biosynthesis enzyme MoaA